MGDGDSFAAPNDWAPDTGIRSGASKGDRERGKGKKRLTSFADLEISAKAGTDILG